jgi:hypothetical protein
MGGEPENPFRSPSAISPNETREPTFPTGRLAASCLLLFSGALCLLLQNGQVFTTSMIFLVLTVTSGLLWSPLAISRKSAFRKLASWIMVFHIALVLIVLWRMPAAYEFQNHFNAKMEELRTKSQKAKSGR